jgi:hypothetical protein
MPLLFKTLYKQICFLFSLKNLVILLFESMLYVWMLFKIYGIIYHGNLYCLKKLNLKIFERLNIMGAL